MGSFTWAWLVLQAQGRIAIKHWCLSVERAAVTLCARQRNMCHVQREEHAGNMFLYLRRVALV
jgi:hypothetical protein